MIATLYLLEHGGVTRVVVGDPDTILLNLEDNEAAVEGNHLGKRIDLATREPLELLQFPIQVGTNLLSGIPAGTWVTVGNDLADQIEDGLLELEVDYPSSIAVTLQHPIYHELTVQVPCEA